MSAGSGSPKGCPGVLQLPKVAMMFLTQGPMPHEPLWEAWLAGISGLVPTLCVANAVCARGGLSVSIFAVIWMGHQTKAANGAELGGGGAQYPQSHA